MTDWNTLHDLSSLGGLPIFIVSIFLLYFSNEQLAGRLLISLLVCYVLISILRLAFFRERPIKKKYKNLFQKIDASSFPSLHAMRAGVLAVVFAKVFNNPLVTGFLVIAMIGVVIARVLLKKHWISDVVVGLVLGAIVGHGVVLL